MTKIFISHKNSDQINPIGDILLRYLYDQGFDVFLDRHSLKSGKWDEAIYGAISTSDVLMVLITEGADSPWVQREIDYARGCRVEVVPVVIRGEELQPDPKTGISIVQRVMRKLEIEKVQFVQVHPLEPGGPDKAFSGLLDFVRIAIADTRAAQQHWVDALRNRWTALTQVNPELKPPEDPVVPQSSYAYLINDLHPHVCRVHLAVGDIVEIEGIPVLVNSENVYMQMQRVFAPGVSKNIRLAGAKRRGIVIWEDTIQQELNEQVFGSGKQVPVEVGEVFVTSAGDKDSELQDKGIRKVFHVAVLNADFQRERPVDDPKDIRKCVLNCLRKFDRVAEADPFDSIAFPILGTGNGKLEVQEAVRNMANGVREYLSRHTEQDSTFLRNIYFVAYTPFDAKKADEILRSKFKEL